MENASIVLEIGNQVGTMMGIATIVDINDTNVTLDFNSPLAGKNLTFDVEVVSIDKASKE